MTSVSSVSTYTSTTRAVVVIIVVTVVEVVVYGIAVTAAPAWRTIVVRATAPTATAPAIAVSVAISVEIVGVVNVISPTATVEVISTIPRVIPRIVPRVIPWIVKGIVERCATCTAVIAVRPRVAVVNQNSHSRIVKSTCAVERVIITCIYINRVVIVEPIVRSAKATDARSVGIRWNIILVKLIVIRVVLIRFGCAIVVIIIVSVRRRTIIIIGVVSAWVVINIIVLCERNARQSESKYSNQQRRNFIGFHKLIFFNVITLTLLPK